MKKIRTFSLATIIFVMLFLFISAFQSVAAPPVSGNVSVVSLYVWRGIRQFDGLALQGTLGSSFKALSFGVWYSSVDFGSESPFFETDPFVELSLPTGKFPASIGATFYAYDFSEFNPNADFEYELFGKLGYGPVGLTMFFLPGQKSTQTNPNHAVYWTEFSTSQTLFSATWSVIYGYGTYSSRFLAEPKTAAVGTVVLSASKTLSETLSVSWNYSIVTDSAMENTAWLGISRKL